MTMRMTRRSQTPGSCFNPANDELLRILRRRIKRGKRPSFITDIQGLYEKEPWLLQHVRHFRSKNNQFFYFVTRTKLAGVRKANSTRTSRKVVGSGRWKTTGTLEEIKDVDGVKVGSIQNVSFLVKNKDKEKKTGWVMHEFLLNIPGFKEVGLCRLQFTPGKDNCNAQYAPRFQPIVIEQPLGEKDGLAGAGKDIVDLDAPQQWNGSCSGVAAQKNQFMGQDSNYMEQQHDLSSTQQKNQIFGQALNKEQQSGHHNSNKVESSERKEDILDDLMNLRKEDWDNIMNLREDLWNNLVSVNEDELDNFTNLGIEDRDYIQSMANDWNNLLSLNDTQPPKQTQEQSLPAQHQKISMSGGMEQQLHFGSSEVPIMMNQALGKA